eukprot:UN30694
MYENPTKDYTPYDMLHEVDKTILYNPGEGGSYSTVGFNLVGLVLASIYGAKSWDKFDLKGHVLNDEYKQIVFPIHGLCNEYENMSHQAGFEIVNNMVTWRDLYNFNCLNSWTGGDIAASTHNIAKFYYEAFNGIIVKDQTLVSKLMDFKTLTEGWSTGMPYSLGMMPLDFLKNN